MHNAARDILTNIYVLYKKGYQVVSVKWYKVNFDFSCIVLYFASECYAYWIFTLGFYLCTCKHKNNVKVFDRLVPIQQM